MAKQRLINFLSAITLLVFFGGCAKDDSTPQVNSEVKTLAYELVNSYPHDTASYTEGLFMHHDTLFESCGSPSSYPQTRSGFGPVDLATGKVTLKVELDRERYWAEGLTCLNDQFYLLTLTSQRGFVYDAKTYGQVREFSFISSQGWGLTTDGSDLIMSDGTNQLSWVDAETFLFFKKKNITQNGIEIKNLNELEFVNGFIYANLWPTNTVVKIDTSTGKVTGILDLALLANDAKRLSPHALEMNGIAYDPASDNFLITGKFWPVIYRIKLKDQTLK
jgi:glutaminyl-peptide cyclotransferase